MRRRRPPIRDRSKAEIRKLLRKLEDQLVRRAYRTGVFPTDFYPMTFPSRVRRTKNSGKQRNVSARTAVLELRTAALQSGQIGSLWGMSVYESTIIGAQGESK